MHNDLFSIGPITIHTYGLMSAIGILSAYFVMTYLAKKRGLDPERIFGLLIACLIFGYLGSKVLYVITQIPTFSEDPSLIWRSFRDGWVVYGGLLGGILGGYIYCRWRNLPTRQYYDVGFTGVALAQGFGRLGCFFAGCCYGVETESKFCTVFSHSDYAPNNVRLVPTQLLSSAGDFLLFIFLLWHLKKSKKPGTTAAWYLILYSLGRIVIEFWRGDTARGSIGPFSTSQFIGLFTAAAGIILMMAFRRIPVKIATVSEETTAEVDEAVATEVGEETAEGADDVTEETVEEVTGESDGEEDREDGEGAESEDA